MKKVREEVSSVIAKPFKTLNPDVEKIELEKVLNFENIFDLKFYGYCFMESLRMEPPVMYSSLCSLT
jgi:hypothetical protein